MPSAPLVVPIPALAQPGLSHSLAVTPADYALLTDLYQLTMSACYLGAGLDQRPASFELTVRRLPPNFGYLIAMGLAQVIDYLQQIQFSPAQIAYLQSTGIFDHVSSGFWDLLAQAQFTGDLWAVPEGTAIYANQPILRIEAPLWQAQLVETYLLNTINYQTLVATRAARLRDLVGPDKRLLEFGTRRAFSPQAATWAARAALAAGFDATSNVLAAAQVGTQPAGTMAHALVMALSATEGSEAQAFQAFNRSFPHSTFLIDTYDPIAAANSLASLQAEGLMQIQAVRIDSGDLVALSEQVKTILPGVAVVASGDLDEVGIQALQIAGAKIDSFGIGTKLVTGQPVNGVYKLVEIDGIPVMKEAAGKLTYPGRKQIYRHSQTGVFQSDSLGLMDIPNSGQPLLQPIIQQGQLLQPLETLKTIRQRTAANVASLPAQLRQIQSPATAPVTLTPELLALTAKTRRDS